jgi:hypothetical protein
MAGAAAGGEPPVTNRSPVAKLNAHVYSSSAAAHLSRAAAAPTRAPVGCRIHFDCTGPRLVERAHERARQPGVDLQQSGPGERRQHGYNPVVIAKSQGCFSYYAEVDGVTSNTSNFCIE